MEGGTFREAVVRTEPFGGRQLHSIRAKSASGSADEGSPGAQPRLPTTHAQGSWREQRSRSPHIVLPSHGEPPSFFCFYLCPCESSAPSLPLRAIRHSLLGEPRLSRGAGGERAVFTASASSPQVPHDKQAERHPGMGEAGRTKANCSRQSDSSAAMKTACPLISQHLILSGVTRRGV